jgi:ATP-dependent helicase IRC3
MITRLKHGVKGRFDKATVRQRSETRTKQRADTMNQRLQGQVAVGPMEKRAQTLKEALLG